MKIEIKNAFISEANCRETNIRVWQPEYPDCFSVCLVLDIGEKGKKASDEFVLRLATPDGLKTLESESSILSYGPLMVVKNYDYEDLWSRLTEVVKKCEDDTWLKSAENLSKYFDYEFDDYQNWKRI